MHFDGARMPGTTLAPSSENRAGTEETSPARSTAGPGRGGIGTASRDMPVSVDFCLPSLYGISPDLRTLHTPVRILWSSHSEIGSMRIVLPWIASDPDSDPVATGPSFKEQASKDSQCAGLPRIIAASLCPTRGYELSGPFGSGSRIHSCCLMKLLLESCTSSPPSLPVVSPASPASSRDSPMIIGVSLRARWQS